MRSLKSHLLVLICILASLPSHVWAQNLPFGQTEIGSISSAAQTNAYTFSAVAGEVVDFTMVTTSGNLVPKMQLFNSSGTSISSNYSGAPYGCSGATLEMNTIKIPSAGTYTLDVGDCSNTNTGDYNIYAQSTNDPVGAENLPFAQVQTGTIGSAAQSITYTISANANDVVDFTMDTTSGSLVPKIRLYNPDGTLNSSNYSGAPYGCSGSTLELNTVTLPVTGTYTVLFGDCTDTDSGGYDIYVQRTESPAGPIGLLFGQTQTSSITSATQSDTYTFSANANDVVDFTMATTSGSLVPKILLYNPDGTLNSSNYSGAPYGCSGSTLELNTVALSVTGTYTMLVGDCADTNTGKYSIYSQRTNNPAGAANLPFAQVQTGLVGSVTQSYTYTFSASANEVVDFTLVTTNGSLVPKIRLYNPNGALSSSNYSGAPYGCSGSTLELNTVTLPATGAYTVLVGDCGDTNTGNFSIYVQSTNTPTEAVPVDWGQVQTGTIGLAAQSSTYTFDGVANNGVDFTIVTTSGNLIPKIRLYNPDGTLNSANYSGAPYGCSGSTVALNSVTLKQNGAYTVLVGDCSDTNTGNYNLSSQCFGTCSATPVITWATPAAITYGTPLSATQLDATSNVAGTFVYSPVLGTLLAAGSHTLSVTFTPTDTADYATATGSVQLMVNMATPAISWATPAAITSGTPLSATQLDATSPVAGTFAYSPAAGTMLAAGVQTLSVTFTPTDTTDYTTATDSVQLTVNNLVPAITTLSPTSATAGVAAQTLTINGKNFVSTSTVTYNGAAHAPTFVSSTQLTITLSTSDQGTPGTYPVVVTNPAPGGGASNSVSFTVTGPVAGISPATLTFAALLVKSTSSSQAVTLSNTGNIALAVASITASGNFAQTNTCGGSVAAGGSCTINVTFDPSVGGPLTGTLTITDNTDNTTGSTQTVSLSGTGQAFTLAPASGSPTTATVAPGQSATYTLSLAGEGGFDQSVSLTCTGAPSESTCTATPSPVTPGSSPTSITVTVTTTAPSLSAPRSRPLSPIPPPSSGVMSLLMLVLALAAMTGVLRCRKHVVVGGWRSTMVLFGAALLLTLALMACGGGGGGDGNATPNQGTPPGAPMLTVTGTSGSGSSTLSHSVALKLTVS